MSLEAPRKFSPVPKKAVNHKLSALGIRLLSRMSERNQGTPLAEKRGPILDRLILQEARAVRKHDAEIDAILSEVGL